MESFEKNNAKFRIEALSKDYENHDIRDFILANLVHDTKWSIFDPQSESRFLKFKGYKAARTYHFENEIKSFYQYSKSHGISYKKQFEDVDGNCAVLNAFLGNEISIDTFIILDKINPFIDGLCQDMIKKSLCLTAVKYQPFVKVKLDEFLKIEEKYRY